MDIREITGYIAHVALASYWLWIIFGTAPQLRRCSRDKRAKLQVLLIKSSAVVLSGLLVGVINFWATQWWHVIVAILVAVPTAILLRRVYRRLVVAPRHRLTLTHRARRFERNYRDCPRPLPLPGQPVAGRMIRHGQQHPT
jgi:hypothetical protein